MEIGWNFKGEGMEKLMLHERLKSYRSSTRQSVKKFEEVCEDNLF